MISSSSPSAGPLDAGVLQPSVAARAWAHGWAISRGTQPPVECAGHFRIFVGLTGHVTRYVLPRLDHEALRRLVSTETLPGTWLKICAPMESVSQLLPSDWNIQEPEFLMSVNLVGGAAPVIPGYRVQTDVAGAVVSARIVADTGEVAASGQAAIDGPFATFDQIVTVEAHRRKGLGRCLMAALSSRSVDLGARHGVLVATEAGAALYEALGWSMVSPVTAASVLAVPTDA